MPYFCPHHMIGLRKFSLKRYVFAMLILALCCALTPQSKAIGINEGLIYSTLTTDTSKPVLKNATRDTIPQGIPKPLRLVTNTDSVKRDTTPLVATTDTFSLRLSKDTLDAPVNYEAEDSAVILAEEKKVILYGKT